MNKPVIVWLLIVCLVILGMIIVGGITRLTDSGLSMVEWKPLMGIMPPTSEAEWRSTFEAYKNYPQYQKVNHGMDLAAFKSIFYWEYGHRVLGRVIGMIYFVPFMIFLLLGRLEKGLSAKLFVGLILGGLQGLMGWYMVKSGLVDLPRVSHYRLAAHLGLALLIIVYLAWLIMDLMAVTRARVGVGFRRLVYCSTALLCLQILYGAFVAGSRAGFGYNTFPLMNGEFIPELATHLTPVWHNLLDNNTMLQFLHRWLGFAVLVSVMTILIQAFRLGNKLINRACLVLLLVVAAQFLLGVFTLINVVPLGLASAHQAGACVLLLVMLYLNYIVQPERSVSQDRES